MEHNINNTNISTNPVSQNLVETEMSLVNMNNSIPINSGGEMGERKKRGRPRKYDAEGNLTPGYLASKAVSRGGTGTGMDGEFSGGRGRGSRGRGRGSRGRGTHAGAGGWNISPCLVSGEGELFANMAGGDFTPHVMNVQEGEDLASKIILFSQKCPGGVCVLSANGTVSNATICQPGSSGGLLTYEGRFEILSLKGSFTVYENGGMTKRKGGLSVSLAGSDGRVIGGQLAGVLRAASPVQLVVATFMQSGLTKAQKRKRTPLAPASAAPVSDGSPNINSYQVPVTQVPAQSYGEAHNHASNNNISDKQDPNSSSDSGEWNVSDPNSGQRPYPDINVSLLE